MGALFAVAEKEARVAGGAEIADEGVLEAEAGGDAMMQIRLPH